MPEEVVKKSISVTLTEPYLKALDLLVEKGVFLNRREIIKDALRTLFRHHGIEPFGKPLEEKDDK